MRSFLFASCFLFTSCSSSNSNNSGLSPDASCDSYLRCLQTSDPSAFAAALNAYGSSSACWHSTTQASQSCSQACVTAKQSLSCGCESDGDCANMFGHCNSESRACVQCLNDGQCSSNPNGKLCDLPSHTCVPCHSNDDCAEKICSTSPQGTPICGGCEYITDGCTSPCDLFYYCTLTQVQMTGAAWSTCLGDDSCCQQTTCGEYSALRACLLQNCGTLVPNPMFTQETADLTLCAEQMCMDTLLACHQNAC